jgi:hypothetical protein
VCVSRDSSVVQRWATGWMIGGSSPGRGWEFFLFTTVSRPALGSTQPPIQWVLGALSLGVKLPGRETDHSPPSSAQIKNGWSYTSPPQCASMVWCSVKKVQRQLYLTELYFTLLYFTLLYTFHLLDNCQIPKISQLRHVCYFKTYTTWSKCHI